ncbi:WD40-repeat-containing domain protein [Catenaria anguillulae PL171]|uniref:WD40 repeat-containing protein SMU1 n=1 Tax=Catenaria anguillulae PL171 TaxID=765915 RepID=A0A1Y2H5E8_9FUNG|nr:WD40-repeat-containing domain protein [Catenaria anguillulae PL171]
MSMPASSSLPSSGAANGMTSCTNSADPTPSATTAAGDALPRDLPSASSSMSSFANERKRTMLAQASSNTLVNNHLRSLGRHMDLLNPADSKIKEDIVRLMVQYLTDEGYLASKLTLQDEANVRIHEAAERQTDLRRLRKAILDGDWAEVDKLVLSSSSSSAARAAALLGKHHKPFLYALYKQQFLELIEHHEVHKAFTFLTKRLKPLEAFQATADEFRDLCYLLTAKSVHDAPAFRNWEGIGPGRERLAEQLQAMVDLEGVDREVFIPPNRLITLLRQAVAYQVEFARYHPKVPPRIQTLLEDYTTLIVPNAVRHTLSGHKDNVKCTSFVGADGQYLVSGSSDNTARLWNTETGAPIAILSGHTSRIWDLSSEPSGQYVATASGDGTVRLWDVQRIVANAGNVAATSATASSAITAPMLAATDPELQSVDPSLTLPPNSLPTIHSPHLVLSGPDQSDIYSVGFHPAGQHLATGGYDRCVRLWDVATGTAVKTFAAGIPGTSSGGPSGGGSSSSHHHGPGHTLAVTAVAFTPMGNLVVSGSKDSTLRFWDVVSGLCVRTLTSHLGEVTSVSLSPSGTYLLTSSKDNANRLWDMRMLPRPLRRLKGHTNTAKNFVRAAFAGPSDGMLVVGGSEDGVGYVWDRESGAVLQKLRGHRGIVYDVRWNARQQLLASCSDDGTVRTWAFDEGRPMGGEEDLY